MQPPEPREDVQTLPELPAAPAPAPTPAPAVVARGLLVRGPAGPALSGIDLEVAAGSVTAILAPEGAGKTALLRVLAGIDPPGAGSVTVLGVDAARDPLGVRARIGWVPERPAFYPTMNPGSLGRLLADVHARFSGRRWVELLGRLGVPPRERVVDLPAAVVARLALAAALAHDPRLLLVDVPASLDAAGRADLLTGVEDEADGRTVLLATSRPHEVARLATHVVVLAGGAVRHAGAAPDLLARARRVEVRGVAPPPLPDGARALRWRGPTSRRPGELLALAASAAQAEGLAALPGATGAAPVDLEEVYLALVAGRPAEAPPP